MPRTRKITYDDPRAARDYILDEERAGRMDMWTAVELLGQLVVQNNERLQRELERNGGGLKHERHVPD